MKPRAKTPHGATRAVDLEQARGRYRRRWWLLWVVVTVAITGTCIGFVGWKHAVMRRVVAGVPVRPNLTGKPAILGELLAKAETKTRTSSAPLDGIVELGRLYHANGFYGEAEACWRLMHDEQPRQARWCHYLADLRRVASDYPEMTALLVQTLELAPDYSPARLQLANLQFKTGDFVAAERNYRLRLAQVPRDSYARLGLVRLAMQKGRADEARTGLEEILKDTPNFSTAHNLYAEILAAAGDAAGASRQRWLGCETLRYSEAEDPWLDELQSSCYDYDRLCVLGTIEFQRENHDRAEYFFERAIALQPGEPDAYEQLSVIYVKQEQPAKARDLLEQALRRLTTTKAPTVLTHLSRAYRLLKQPAEAARVARRGLELAGDSAELLQALGVALADSGRHDEAVGALQAALARNPNDAGINYNLAVSFLALGRLDETLEALDRSLTLQPTFPATLLLRGRIEMAAGHWERVEAYLRPVFESHPENLEARHLMAEWHLHLGTEAESNNLPAAAERHYRDGLSAEESNPELQGALGVFYLVHARFAEAVEPLESHLRLQPEDAPGCLYLGQAYAALGRQDKAREILTQGVRLAEQFGDARTANSCRERLRQL